MNRVTVKQLFDELQEFDGVLKVNFVCETPGYRNVHGVVEYNVIQFDHNEKSLQFAYDMQRPTYSAEQNGILLGTLLSSLKVLCKENSIHGSIFDYFVCKCKINKFEYGEKPYDVVYLKNIKTNKNINSLSFPDFSAENVINNIFLEFLDDGMEHTNANNAEFKQLKQA